MHCQLVASFNSWQRYRDIFLQNSILNIVAGILQSLHREISLETCPILLTPEPPTIVQQGGKEGKKPEYEPVTAGSTTVSTSTILAVAGLSLTGWARLATYWGHLTSPLLLPTCEKGRDHWSQTFIRKKIIGWIPLFYYQVMNNNAELRLPQWHCY